MKIPLIQVKQPYVSVADDNLVIRMILPCSSRLISTLQVDTLWRCKKLRLARILQSPTCQNFSRYSSNTTRPEVVEESNDPFIVHSPIDDIVIPEAHISKMVWSSVFRTPTTPFRTALINGDDGRTYSYKESYNLTRNFASSLVKFGVCKGDVLAMVLPNSPEFVFVFTGAPLAGVVVTTHLPALHPLRDPDPAGQQRRHLGRHRSGQVPQGAAGRRGDGPRLEGGRGH